MDDTTPPTDAPREPRERGTTDRFFTWLRGLGITRSGDRWFAGVAGGIAAKAGIDPLIVRGIFVVLAILGGPGLLLYLAGWLLLPDAGGRIHVEDVIRGRASAGVIVAVVILGALIVIPIIFGLTPGIIAGPWAWDIWNVAPDGLRIAVAVLWWAVVLPALIIWFIVWATRRRSPRTPDPETWTDRTARRVGEWGEDVGSRAGAWGEHVGRSASEWGENAGRKAGEWGEQVGRQAEEWGRREADRQASLRLDAAHVVITLACALLAAGAAAGWAVAIDAHRDIVITAGLVAAVAVLGLSAIIAGIRGRGSGWVGFLAFVGVIALLIAPVTSLLPGNTRFVPFGSIDTHVSAATPEAGIIMIAGNSRVDLTELDRSDDPHEIEVWMLGGNVTVQLPDAHPVEVRIELLGGNIKDHRGAEEVVSDRGIFISRSFASTVAPEADDPTRVHVRLMGGNVTLQGGLDPALESERLQREIAELEQRIQEQEALEERSRSDRERLEELTQELEDAR